MTWSSSLPRLRGERDALQARVAVQSRMIDDLTRISREDQARAQLLTAALTRLVDAIAPGDVPDGALRNARAVLAAGVTESEA